MAGAFELVIFDCDGVLVDSERLVVGIESALLGELGWPLSPDGVVELFMGRSEDAVHAIVAERIGPRLARVYARRVKELTLAAFRSELVAIDGAAGALGALGAAGVATCVASSGSHDKMGVTLRATGLWPLVEGRIFSADDVAHGKPEPDLFLHAARSMGADPARCAVVEDSVPGVRAALAAGMTVFGYLGGLAPPGALVAAGARPVAHLGDLAALVTGER